MPALPEHVLPALLEASSEGMYAVDAEGRCIYVNRAARELLGYSAAECRGRNMHELVHGDDAPGTPHSVADCPIYQALAHGRSQRQARETLRRRDGTFVPVLASCSPLREEDRIIGAAVAVLDLTGWQQQAGTLQESEQRFRAIWEAAGDAMALSDREGTVLAVNSAYCQLYGYSREEVEGQNFAVIFPEVQRAWANELYQAAFESPEITPAYEVTIRRKDGSERIVESRADFLTRQGQRTAMLSVIRDITERKHAERERQRFVSVVQNSRDLISIANLEGGVLFLNQAGQRLVGIGEDGAVRRTRLIDYFFPENRSFIEQEVLPQVVQQGHWTGEIAFRHFQTGAAILAIWDVFRIDDPDTGQPLNIATVTRDISERKRREENQRFLAEASKVLSESLDYEQALQQVASLAVPQLADRCMIDVAESERFRRVAVACADPDRQHLAEQLIQFPPDWQEAEGAPRALQTGEPLVYPEVSEELLRAIVRSDEHMALVRQLGANSYLNVPLIGQDDVIGAITFVMAESERRYGPDDVPLAQELASRAALAVSNARLYEAAQRAIQQRDEMLATVSHDLKNPLTAVRGYAQLLNRQLARGQPIAPETLSQTLSSIEQLSTQTMQQLGELVEVAKVQQGAMLSLRRKPTDLVGLANQLVETLQQTSDTHQLRLESSEDRLVGTWDELRIRRVLANLLNNALKYSPRGGTVTVQIAQQAEPSGNWAVLSVQDEGIGIPASDLPHIFDHFRRGSNVGTSLSGEGIGLSSARQVVEQHGGSITAASEEGRGSTFTIRLPVRKV